MQRVLVVDDSPLIHALIKRTLADRPELEVGFASNGEEALGVVRSCPETPLLLLLDINMPIMNGLEVLAQLDALGARDRVKVILVSSDEHDVLGGFAAGADAYLRKPFTMEALCGVVDGVLAREMLAQRVRSCMPTSCKSKAL
jgi:CheY-like chemotaxis protein